MRQISKLVVPIIVLAAFFVIGVSYSEKEPITISLILADLFLATIIVLAVDRFINRLKKEKTGGRS